MKKVLFIDRDGTLIKEPEDDFQVDSFEKFEFMPGMLTWLGKIAKELDYELVMVSNQDGLGTDSYPEEKFLPIQNFLLNTLKGEGIVFNEILIDRSFDFDNKPTRKPGIQMLEKYLNGEYDLSNSYVIGDRLTDVQLAKNMKSRSILYQCNKEKKLTQGLDLSADDWKDIFYLLRLPERIVAQSFVTNETEIFIRMNLDGKGKSNISTGIGFFDHMLEQIVKHGNIDIELHAKGDLHVDEHHTIEDVGIALGETFRKSLGNKLGIERYGFCLPMDDCLAQVALDFSGRAAIVWDAEFHREKIGDMPTEMFFHFFKSFSDSAKCNLNIKAEGQNEHHKIESIFKAFARAIKIAVKRDAENMIIPSTKGIL